MLLNAISLLIVNVLLKLYPLCSPSALTISHASATAHTPDSLHIAKFVPYSPCYDRALVLLLIYNDSIHIHLTADTHQAVGCAATYMLVWYTRKGWHW